jgi:Ca2+-binding RTX toxin-like protein
MYEDELSQYIQNVLQREPNPGEVESYQSIIDNNVASLDEVLGMIINSSEAVDNVYPVILAYQAIYGRVPDAGGLEYWTGVYESNHGLDNPNTTTVNETMVAVLKAFVNPAQTPEFVSRYGANPSGDQFVAAAYQNVLNRAPDQAGLTYWQARYAQIHDQLEAKAEADTAAGRPALTAAQIDVETRAQILEQFVDSAEYKTATAEEVDAFLTDRAHGEDASGSLWDFDPNAHVGQTFTLTENSDTLQGLPGNLIGSEGTVDNSQDDTIIAGTSVAGGIAQNNLGSGDIIDGGIGHDVLRIIDDAGAALTPNMTNVEVIEAQALAFGGLEINMINTSGATELWNERSTSTIQFNNIQEEAAVGVHDSTAQSEFNFGNGLAPSQLTVALQDTDSNIYVSFPDVGSLTELNIQSAGENYIRLDVDDNPGFGGNTAAFETINIVDGPAGNAGALDGLELDPGIPGTEFDFVTQVNAESFTGWLDMDLGNNDQDIDFNGGLGNTYLDTGDGDSTITTQDGADEITVGNGNNNITTAGGDDYVQLGHGGGAGDNVVDTGEGNDIVEAWHGGDQDITLGAGDDQVLFGFSADVDDTAHGGDGIDTIGIAVGTLDTLTADSAFAGQIDGFEKVYAWGQVNGGNNYEINLANLDDINYVKTDGTASGVTSETSGATFGDPVQTTAGHASASERQELDVGTAPTNTGDITLTFDTNGDGVNGAGDTVVTVGVNAGWSLDQTADAIVNAVTNAAVPGVTIERAPDWDAALGYIDVHFDSSLGDVPLVGFADTDTTGLTFVHQFEEIKGDSTEADEVQTVHVNSGTDSDGGVISVGGVNIELAGGLTANQVGSAIVDYFVAHAADAETLGLDLTASGNGVSYDTISGNLTFQFDQSQDDVDNGPASPVHITDVTPGLFENTLTIDYTATGGTLEMNGANNGETDIVGAGPDFNIIMDSNYDSHDGVLVMNGVENLNITTVDASVVNAAQLNLNAQDLASLTLSGPHGVDFGPDGFDNLTSFNGSGVTSDSAHGGDIRIVTNANADTSLTGGAGDDNLTGSNAAAHVDTINGGAGDDTIIGREGADVLTGGAGHDTFVYQAVTDSQGVTVDTIADFVSGEDKLDFSGVTGGTGEYTGAADGYGAVLTSLTHTAGQAVLDSATSTLYVDVDGSGTLDSHDMAVHLTGIISLDHTTDFTW